MPSFYCAIIGRNDNDIFPINIHEAQTVGELKDEIKKKGETTGPAHTLTVHQVNVAAADAHIQVMEAISQSATCSQAMEAMKAIHPQLIRAIPHTGDTHKRLTNPFQELSTFLPPTPVQGTIYILVELPQATPLGGPRGTKRAASTEEPDSPSKRLRAEHSIACKNALNKAIPPIAAKPANLSSQQRNNPILNGRPGSASGPPIVIFEQVFADFSSSMRASHIDGTVSPDYYENVSSLLVASSGYFKEESEGKNQLQEILGRLLGRALQVRMLEDQTSNDGVCVANVKDDQRALLLLCEMNIESGRDGCDPSIQASFAYSRWWSQSQARFVSTSRDSSLCASFILAIYGPWISVHGAILLGENWVVQPLSDFIWTGVTVNLGEQVGRVTRLFNSLKTGLARLEEKYKATSADLYFPFPDIRSYSISNTTVEITYEKQLHSGTSTMGFLGRNTEGKKLFIKFTTEYNETAHRLLAEKQYAPQLLYHSEFSSGWFIVVMEYIEGHDMHGHTFSDHDMERVHAAKNILHGDGIVFGDLRPNNIMRPNHGPGLLLVDFDWCGKAGESRYPPTLNGHRDCGWHKDVGRGAIMKKEHDDYLLASFQRV